jgi:hypothetical protein
LITFWSWLVLNSDPPNVCHLFLCSFIHSFNHIHSTTCWTLSTS